MKNKITALLIIPLFLTGLNARAAQELSVVATNYDQKIAQNLTSVVFDQMEDEGLLTNVNDDTVAAAEQMVNTIVNDKELFEAYLQGDLILDEQTLAQYGLFDDIFNVVKKVVGGVKKVGEAVEGEITDVAKKGFELAKAALPVVKDALSRVAKYANIGMQYIADNKVVNEILTTGVGVLGKVIKIGAPIIGPALAAIPIAGPPLSAVVSVAGPILGNVLTKDNAQALIKFSSAITNVGDKLLNPAPKGVPVAKPGQVTDAATVALKGTEKLMTFVAKLSPAERKKLPSQVFTAIDKGRKLLSKIGNVRSIK